VNKTAIAVLGSVSAVALAGGAQASTAANPPAEFPQPARSFAELLDPIPNAAAVLEAYNTQAAASHQASMQLAQIYIGPPPHHHHHHYRPYYYGHYPGYHHHHHHHHHHPGVYIPLPQ
jgi:hypothetical protein